MPDLLAERVGFEPTVRVSAHLISNQARSTTPAPLHADSRIGARIVRNEHAAR